MTPVEKCPFCGSQKVFAGTVKSSEGAFEFCPQDAQVPFWKPVIVGGLPFGPEAQMCVACGRLWSDIDPQKATTFIQRYGSNEAKAKL